MIPIIDENKICENCLVELKPAVKNIVAEYVLPPDGYKKVTYCSVKCFEDNMSKINSHNGQLDIPIKIDNVVKLSDYAFVVYVSHDFNPKIILKGIRK